MCQERDGEEVKGVLPYWPRIYCKISVVSLIRSNTDVRSSLWCVCLGGTCDVKPMYVCMYVCVCVWGHTRTMIGG